jgi:hypothetical protein
VSQADACRRTQQPETQPPGERFRKPHRVALARDQGLSRHAAVFRIIAAHASSEEQGMFQRCGAEAFFRAKARQSFARQADCVSHGGTEQAATQRRLKIHDYA